MLSDTYEPIRERIVAGNTLSAQGTGYPVDAGIT
jgi:hypothetical protein